MVRFGHFLRLLKLSSQEVIATNKLTLTISNVSELKHKVTTDWHIIGALPWRVAGKTETSKRTNHTKYFRCKTVSFACCFNLFFSVYVDCNPESESTLWSCTADVEFVVKERKDIT